MLVTEEETRMKRHRVFMGRALVAAAVVLFSAAGSKSLRVYHHPLQQ